MNLTDFLQRIRYNDETWKFICDKAESKFKFEERVITMNKRMKHYKGQVCMENRNDKLDPMDFIKENFWGQ